MEKNLKRIKTIAVVLIVILITAIAFGGLYIKERGIWENKLPKFSFGMELDGIRELRFVLDISEEEKEIYLDSEGNYAGDVEKDTSNSSTNTNIDLVDESGNPINNTDNTEKVEENKTEEQLPEGYKIEKRLVKVNADEDINYENFEKSKKIIQQRLETLELYEYNIRLDNVTGELIVEVPDNDKVQIEEALIGTRGKFEVVDTQNGLILLDNSNIKNVTSTYTHNEEGYQAYLIVQLNNEGKEELKNISNKYVTTTSETGTNSTKYVTIKLDGQKLLETYFGEELPNGVLQIPLGQPTEEYTDFSEVYSSTTRIAQMLNSDKLPLAYKLSGDNYIQSYVTNDMKNIALISFAIIVAILSIVMIVKHKLNGLKLSIFNVGYIATLVLIFKYTNVLITFNSLIAFVGVVGINILFLFKLLNNLNNSQNVKLVFEITMKELYLAIIPVCIIAIVFTFMSGAVISSIGMVLFWGLAIQAAYNGLLCLIGVI